MAKLKRIISYWKSEGEKQFFRKVFFSCFNPVYMNTKFITKSLFASNAVVINASIPCKNHRFPRLDNLNWGDDINLILPRLIAGKPSIPYKYSPLAKLGKRKNIIAIGSVLTWLTNEESIIWGSGVINPERRLPAKPKKVLAVRGPLTREYLLDQGVSCPNVFGDPALLLPKFYQPKVEKKYTLGIIPHLTHQDHPALNNFKSDPSVLIIDIVNYGKWSDFVDKVLSCEYIVSSSLHGLILADAYNLPNKWIGFFEMNEIKRFKYRDYYQSVGKEIEYPFVLDESTTKNMLLEEAKEWKPNNLDLEPLNSCCPF